MDQSATEAVSVDRSGRQLRQQTRLSRSHRASGRKLVQRDLPGRSDVSGKRRLLLLHRRRHQRLQGFRQNFVAGALF